MSELTPERITAFFDRVAADWDEMRLVYRAMREMFGRTLDNIDDERFIAGWVDVALAVAERHGLAPERRGDPAALTRPDLSS